MKKSIVLEIIFLIMILPLQGLMATDVVFKVVVPSTTTNCWIAGNYNNWDLVNAKLCTKVDPTHYTATFNYAEWDKGVTADNIQYKYVNNNCDWVYVERNTNGGEVPLRTYKVGSTDTVARWNDWVYESSIRISATTPKGTNECYIYGDIMGLKVPDESGKMEKNGIFGDSIVVFSKLIYTYSICLNKSTFRFSSGPSLDYDQLIPSESFNSSDLNPIVTAWKATYTAAPQVPVSKIKIYSNASDIIIEGTETNDMVNVYGVTGLKIMTFKSNGERIVFAAQKHEIYFVKTTTKSAKIILN